MSVGLLETRDTAGKAGMSTLQTITRMIDPLTTGQLARQCRARSLRSRMKTLAPLTHEDRSQSL